MDRTKFEEPVSILVGLGYPAKIESASQAYQLLCELPLATGKPARSVAARACKLAMEGKVDPETARSAFSAFARRMAMLVGDMPDYAITSLPENGHPPAPVWQKNSQ